MWTKRKYIYWCDTKLPATTGLLPQQITCPSNLIHQLMLNIKCKITVINKLAGGSIEGEEWKPVEAKQYMCVNGVLKMQGSRYWE